MWYFEKQFANNESSFLRLHSFTNVFSLLQTETRAWFLIFVHLCSEELIF